ncbi:MAG: FlgD immunoglobulin-like domain containing protein [Elusimicrobia bacterium]|nr:FlgD immunoglobulin-like domain containing protein [Elusimicrobiota bacterium]
MKIHGLAEYARYVKAGRLAFWLLLAAAPARAVPAFLQEPGLRLSSGAAQALVGNRLYFIENSTVVRSAATADDGLSFAMEAGMRLSTATEPRVEASSITGLSMIALAGGGFRMLYSALGSTGTLYRIYSATSADGLAWANDTGTRVELNNGASFLASPSLAALSGGRLRVYFTGSSDGTLDPAARRVYSALSTNAGRDFAAPTLVVDERAGEVAAMARTDGRIRLLYTAPVPPVVGGGTNSTIVSALTSAADLDGTVFELEPGVRVATTAALGPLSNPFIIRSTDAWRWRLYYNWNPFSAQTDTAAVYSASTYAPDPISVTPAVVLRTAGAVNFTIKGESFSLSPSAQLGQGGAVAAGAGLTRVDDQTLTVNFTLTGANLGHWNLSVTNDNGFTDTLANAVLVDFAPGEVRLTDNLLRPRLGTRTRIDAMTFNAGRLTLRLYTLSGELVAVIFDGEVPEGTTTFFWDGKTAAGNTVASGVYVLRALGQKIDSKSKIVVIK